MLPVPEPERVAEFLAKLELLVGRKIEGIGFDDGELVIHTKRGALSVGVDDEHLTMRIDWSE
jgi:hypothetical protein